MIANKIVGSSEVKYVMFWWIDYTTTIVSWIVDEVVGSTEGKRHLFCYVNCTTDSYFITDFYCMTTSIDIVNTKLLMPLKFSVIATAQIAPAPTSEACTLYHLFFRKVVFPVNVRILFRAVIPHPELHLLLNGSQAHCFWVNSFSTRVMLVLHTVSAVPTLSWKEQLTSLCILCGLQKQGRGTSWMTTIAPGPVVRGKS